MPRDGLLIILQF